MKKYILTAFIFIFSITMAFAQCPMCKAVAMSAQKENGQHHALSLNDGILYLLGLPFFAMSIIAIVWYRRSLKIKAEI